MKKLSFVLMALLLVAVFAVKPAQAAYLSEYDKYIEVTPEQARFVADAIGLENIPLSQETAQLSFEIQESFIAELEKILGTEIDRYYIWLTINGEPVLAIDPPVIAF